jgi:hypothetical protein
MLRAPSRGSASLGLGSLVGARVISDLVNAHVGVWMLRICAHGESISQELSAGRYLSARSGTRCPCASTLPVKRLMGSAACSGAEFARSSLRRRSTRMNASGGSLRARRWYVAADRDVSGRGILIGVGVLVHHVLGVDVSMPLPGSFSSSSRGQRRLAIVHRDLIAEMRRIRVGFPWGLLPSLLPLSGGIAAALGQHGAVFC